VFFPETDVDRTVTYSLSFAWTHAKEALRVWLATRPALPNVFNEDFGFFYNHLVDGDSKKKVIERGVGLGGIYVVGSKETLEEAQAAILAHMSELLAVPGAGQVSFEPSTFDKTIRSLASARRYKPYSATRLVFSERALTDSVMDGVLERLTLTGETMPGLHGFGVELLGGKIAEVRNTDTAFWPRQAHFFYDMFSYWDSSLDSCVNVQALEALFGLVYEPDRGDNIYMGFPIDNLPNHLTAYFGQNQTRLQQIKEKIDPLHVLRFPTGLVEK